MFIVYLVCHLCPLLEIVSHYKELLTFKLLICLTFLLHWRLLTWYDMEPEAPPPVVKRKLYFSYRDNHAVWGIV